MSDEDDKKIKKLLDDAHDTGALSAKSLAMLDVVTSVPRSRPASAARSTMSDRVRSCWSR